MNQISLDQSVQSYEDGKIAVYATPYTLNAQILSLEAGEAFEADVSGASTTPLVASDTHYTATLATSAPAPLDVTISLLRAQGQAKSTVKLPVPPRVANAPPSLTQGEDLVIVLAEAPPPNVIVTVRLLDVQTLFGDVSPTCLELANPVQFARVEGGTRVILSSATLFARDPAKKAPERTCDVKVGVRFETKGTRDPALGGGGISGLMERPAYATGGVHMTRTDL
jgi:hypothetical protein